MRTMETTNEAIEALRAVFEAHGERAVFDALVLGVEALMGTCQTAAQEREVIACAGLIHRAAEQIVDLRHRMGDYREGGELPSVADGLEVSLDWREQEEHEQPAPEGRVV